MSSDKAAADSREIRDATQHQCILCNQPNHADRKMVQCDVCDRWFHFRCVGVNDSIEDPERSFRCTSCTVPDPPGSTVSTSASIREARLQLEVQRLAEEKRLQEKVLAEREKQERDLQEMTLRLERERVDKAVKEKFAMEKESIKKKYDLLHTHMDDDEAGSVRSRYNRGTEDVVDWIFRNPAETMRANPGHIPTGLTSDVEPIPNSVHQSSAAANSEANLSRPIPSFTSNVQPISPNAPISQITHSQSPIKTFGREIATSAVNVQRCAPSATVAMNNMFVISPTTTTTVSFTLPAITTQPTIFMPSNIPQSLSSLQLPQSQSATQSVPQLSSHRIAHTTVASCLPSGGIPSVWQRSSGVGMPPPTHQSTPTSLPWERRPAAESYAYQQPVRSQEIQQNSVSIPVSRASLHPSLGENARSVGQYVQPAMGVSSSYTMYDTRNSYQNCISNYWLQGANHIPLQTAPQLGNISSYIPGPFIDESTGYPGYQNIPINQTSDPPSQHVPRSSQLTSGHGGGSLPEPTAPGSLPAALDLGPNALQIAARQVVPRELPTFDGNPADWPLFWSSYSTSTQMCGYTGAENLFRLQRCLKGEAKSAVSSFLLHPSNVDDILSTLRTLFGRPDAIINTLLNDVRNTPTPKPEKLETLVSFGLVVRNLCAHLVSAGQEMHLANPILLQELEEKLPANVKLGWAMHKQTVAAADLRTFSGYMNVIINAASLVSSCHVEGSKTERQKGKAFVNSVRSENSIESDQQYEKSGCCGKSYEESRISAVPEVRPCAVCQVHGHKPKDCPAFKDKSLFERWKTVQEAHLCKRCLYPHGKWPCKASACGIDGCQDNHHKSLHPGNPGNADNIPGTSALASTSGVVTVHQHLHQKILFRIIPVCLHGNGKSVNTFAFLDSGSDSTLLESSIAKKLGVTGGIFPLCMQWTNGIKRTEENSKRVQLEIAGTSGKRFSMSGVHTVSSLDLPHQTINHIELQEKFPYLKGLPIPSYVDAVPGILIGLDNAMLSSTLRLREGSEEQPTAAKTRLGWMLYGRSGELDSTSLRRVSHQCQRSRDEVPQGLVKSVSITENSRVWSNNIGSPRVVAMSEKDYVEASTEAVDTDVEKQHNSSDANKDDGDLFLRKLEAILEKEYCRYTDNRTAYTYNDDASGAKWSAECRLENLQIFDCMETRSRCGKRATRKYRYLIKKSVDNIRKSSTKQGIFLNACYDRNGCNRSSDMTMGTGDYYQPLTKKVALDVLKNSGMAEGTTSSNTGRSMCATVQDPSLPATTTDSTDPEITGQPRREMSWGR